MSYIIITHHLLIIKMILILDLGEDKIAAIIQTGRDHGLPTYTQVRRDLNRVLSLYETRTIS